MGYYNTILVGIVQSRELYEHIESGLRLILRSHNRFSTFYLLLCYFLNSKLILHSFFGLHAKIHICFCAVLVLNAIECPMINRTLGIKLE